VKTIEEVRQVVAELLPDEHADSDLSRSGVLLLSALIVSPSHTKLRSFSGLPPDFILNARFYLRACGVWTGNHPANYGMEIEWAGNPRTAVTAFRMDCLVAAGRVVRASEDGQTVYRLRTMADYSTSTDPSASQVLWADVAKPEEREARRLALAEDHARDPGGPARRRAAVEARAAATRSAPANHFIATCLACEKVFYLPHECDVFPEHTRGPAWFPRCHGSGTPVESVAHRKELRRRAARAMTEARAVAALDRKREERADRALAREERARQHEEKRRNDAMLASAAAGRRQALQRELDTDLARRRAERAQQRETARLADVGKRGARRMSDEHEHRWVSQDVIEVIGGVEFVVDRCMLAYGRTPCAARRARRLHSPKKIPYE
jgi:hypothetical protein